MRLVRFRFLTDLRRRWPAWVGLALVIGLFGGAVLGAVAGARRTDTAYQRFERSQRAADVLVEDFIPNPDATTVTHDQVRSVAHLADPQLVHSYLASVTYQNTPGAGVNLVSTPDGRAYGTGVDRPKVLRGRMPDPTKLDEVAVDSTLRGAHIGDRITSHLTRNVGGNTHRPDRSAAPIVVAFRVTGIVAVPGQFPPQSANGYYTGADVYATPAFDRAYASKAVAIDIDLARLRPGSIFDQADRDVQQLHKGGLVPTFDLSAQAHEVKRSTHLEATALWILAALLAGLGVLVAGQLLSRSGALEANDHPILRAVGVDRRQLLGVGIARTVFIGAIGAIVAAAVAVATSRFTPIGLARAAEPHPGLAFDWAILALGALGVVPTVAFIALPSLWHNTARTNDGEPRPSRIARRLAAAGGSAPSTSGVRMALERGHGRSAVPVRSTLAGAIIAVGAVTAAITFGASLTHLLASPRLFGVTWDADIFNGQGPGGLPPAEAVVRADRDIEAASYRYVNLSLRLNGRRTEGIALLPVKGTLGATIVAGRAPTGPDEIALGARTLHDLHLQLGDTVQSAAENDTAPGVPLRVVGSVVLPPGSFVGRLGQGAVVSGATLDNMANVASGFKLRRPYIMSVRFRPGVDRNAATHKLSQDLAKTDPQFSPQHPPTPNDLVNFGRIQNLPLVLASLLAFLAAATITHLLISSVQRRRHELAILKTIGFDRRQIRTTVAWQATTIAVFAAVGIPLGTAVGRVAWTAFATNLGVLPRPVSPLLPLLLGVPAIVTLTNLVALVPASIAAHMPPSTVLRSD